MRVVQSGDRSLAFWRKVGRTFFLALASSSSSFRFRSASARRCRSSCAHHTAVSHWDTHGYASQLPALGTRNKRGGR